MQDYKKLFDLGGKSAVVIGAASGIGRASAEAIASLGARVICADADLAGAQSAAADIVAIGGQAEAWQINAADGAEIEALAQHALKAAGKIDIAVSTPALNIRKLIVDYTEEEYDRVMNLNMKGAFNFFRSFGRPMMKQGFGSIVACSSMRAVTIEPGLGVYAASKAGIAQLVKAFAAEMGPYNVRVNAVMPSIIETRLTAPLKERADIFRTYAGHTVLNRWGQPSEVGSAVAFLASDAASYISGSSLSVDGGWTAIDGPPTGLTSTRPSE
ncbi:SDR family NAD(P)-dependent oxidoreductase [Herbaspirillum sp. SJZ099]|uniref:SDR family NAD(P)-dependent oxidoreductase n=1 Tax=Herbaspirillum sp. SJZ099 TaxID=2572916 RepID=UPI0011AA1747|nr:SDR family NAD(P)-dependent oxidoreductase [Herbaspirillum sp. SJZ099]TWC66439.1 NAD(P)-dependent dehydrogenase (short-subunit alcohol dehydrogenase family) [Herbaspirillum sp. SJZ099]